MEFLQAAYEAAATHGGRDRASLEDDPHPLKEPASRAPSEEFIGGRAAGH